MPTGHLKTGWILENIIILSLVLCVSGVSVYASKNLRHQAFHVFHDFVWISGVLDALERVQIGESPTRYEVRLLLQDDQHLYVVKDSVLSPALDWEKFSAKEPVGSSVNLRVERPHLSQWRQRRRTKIDVYGLESSRGIYLTLEDSLRDIRVIISLVFLILGFGFGIFFLNRVKQIVFAIQNPLSLGGRNARRKSFNRKRRRVNGWF